MEVEFPRVTKKNHVGFPSRGSAFRLWNGQFQKKIQRGGGRGCEYGISKDIKEIACGISKG